MPVVGSPVVRPLYEIRNITIEKWGSIPTLEVEARCMSRVAIHPTINEPTLGKNAHTVTAIRCKRACCILRNFEEAWKVAEVLNAMPAFDEEDNKTVAEKLEPWVRPWLTGCEAWGVCVPHLEFKESYEKLGG